MDCRNNGECRECSFNHILKGKAKYLKKDTEYCIRLKDGSVVNGSDKYVYFLENHCYIVGVCELYKREDDIMVMSKEALIKEIMRVRPNLFSVCKLEVMDERWLINKLNELRGE